MGTDLNAINDDYLVYRSKDIHIWKYPVIGETSVPTEDNKQGQLYFQLTIPSDKVTKDYEGRTVDWYQPVHENGNIFSYPWDKNQIENLGDIKTKPHDWGTGSNDASFSIVWTNDTESVVEVSTEKKISVDASVSVGGEIMEADTKVTVKGHYDHTWSSMKSSETSYSQSHGITIAKSPLDTNYVYQFSPLIFKNSVSGVLQVSYVVDPLALSGAEWWKSNYNQKPDLALNLPNRWNTEEGVDWEFNEGGLKIGRAHV